MQNITVKGIISNTSNKVDGKFTVKNPTKTVYIETDEKNSEMLKKFGMEQYESKDGQKFFITRLTQSLAVYHPETHELTKSDDLSSVDTNNWKTETEIGLNFIKAKSEQFDTEFYRLQAINATIEQIVEVAPQNPFLEQDDSNPF